MYKRDDEYMIRHDFNTSIEKIVPTLKKIINKSSINRITFLKCKYIEYKLFRLHLKLIKFNINRKRKYSDSYFPIMISQFIYFIIDYSNEFGFRINEIIDSLNSDKKNKQFDFKINMDSNNPLHKNRDVKSYFFVLKEFIKFKNNKKMEDTKYTVLELIFDSKTGYITVNFTFYSITEPNSLLYLNNSYIYKRYAFDITPTGELLFANDWNKELFEEYKFVFGNVKAIFSELFISTIKSLTNIKFIKK